MTRWLLSSAAAVAMMSTLASAAPIYIDFNASGSKPENFNAVGANEEENKSENLVDAEGKTTEVDVTVSAEGKRASGRGGVTSPTGDAEEFGAAMGDYLYGKAMGLERSYFDIVFTGLEPGATYNFVGSASRAAEEGTTQNTRYQFTGANEVETTLEPTNNSSEVFRAEGVTATEQGEIKLRVSSASSVEAGNMYLISALKMERAQ